MTDSMVSRVARRIEAKLTSGGTYEDAAREAIDEMRVPTEAMVTAGAAEIGDVKSDYATEVMIDAYDKMVAAALAEERETSDA